MSQDNAAQPDIDLPRRRRLRFGLKTLFIVVTALCLWLGYHVVRERRADEILARHDAVLAALVKQIATAPAQTFHSISHGSEDEVLHRLGYPDKQFRRATSLRVDHSGSTTSQNLAVDVSKLLEMNTHPTTIADRLAQPEGEWAPWSPPHGLRYLYRCAAGRHASPSADAMAPA